MLDLDKVVSLFSLFSDLNGEELERWRGVCESAALRVTHRLREGVNPAAEQEILCAAAAAWAYCDYLVLDTASERSDSIKVGDVALGGGSGGHSRKDAEGIRDYFLGQAAHLLRPDYPVLVFTEGERMLPDPA